MSSRVGANGTSRVSGHALERLFFRWNMKLLECKKRFKEFGGRERHSFASLLDLFLFAKQTELYEISAAYDQDFH